MSIRYLALFVILIIVTACTDWGAAAGSPIHRKERGLINVYSDQLWNTIRTKNVDAFLALRYSKGDLCENIKTGAPILILSDDKDPTPARAQLEREFTDFVRRLEMKIGSLSNARCTRVAYLISEDPFALKIGLFRFDVTLMVEANGKNAYIYQSSSFLSVHGVRWLRPPELTDDPGPT